MNIEELITNQLKEFENEYGNYNYSLYNKETDEDSYFDDVLDEILCKLKNEKAIKEFEWNINQGCEGPGYDNWIVSVAILTNENKLMLLSYIKECY